MIIYVMISFLVGITTIIAAINMLGPNQFRLSADHDPDGPFVSILIPAHNEEDNISSCLDSLLRQTYQNYEILFMNDRSKDRTAHILQNYQNKYPNVQFFTENTSPPGWIPKNWACHQLSAKARGDILLFIDADVRLHPGALASGLKEFSKSNIQLLSCFPSQEIHTPAEWLTAPLINWLLLSFLPLQLVHKISHPLVTAADGQWMMFDANAYRKINGHQAVRNHLVEDMQLAKCIKQNGFSMKTVLGGEAVTCRMYDNFQQAINSLTKSFFPGVGSHDAIFVFFVLWITWALVFPLIAGFYARSYLFLTVFIFIQRVMISVASRQNATLNIIFHPLQMVMFSYVGILSLYRTRTDRLKWRNQTIVLREGTKP